jgi:alpha-D-xyloside xylohydrolase
VERGHCLPAFNLGDGGNGKSKRRACGESVVFTLKATRSGGTVTIKGEGEARNWSVCLRNVQQVSGVKGGSHAGSEWGVVVKAEGDEVVVHLCSPHPNPLPKGAREWSPSLPFRVYVPGTW